MYKRGIFIVIERLENRVRKRFAEENVPQGKGKY